MPRLDELPHTDEFRKWLKRNGMSTRVISDTLSRVKRASAFVSLAGPADDDSLRQTFQQSRSYAILSVFVRSQLKRAVILYRTLLISRR